MDTYLARTGGISHLADQWAISQILQASLINLGGSGRFFGEWARFRESRPIDWNSAKSPTLRESRNSARPHQLGGNIAGFRPIDGGFLESSRLRRRTGRAVGPRTTEIYGDFRHLVREVRNSALSPRVCGDFAKYRMRGEEFRICISPTRRIACRRDPP